MNIVNRDLVRSRSPGDERNPVDYVFVSVDPAVTQEPRPDLLDKVGLMPSRLSLASRSASQQIQDNAQTAVATMALALDHHVWLGLSIRRMRS
jgi:hypothetical protein